MRCQKCIVVFVALESRTLKSHEAHCHIISHTQFISLAIHTHTHTHTHMLFIIFL